MILFNTGSFLTGRTSLPLKGTASAIYSCAFYSITFLCVLSDFSERPESSERHTAHQKSLVGGRKSGRRSKRTRRNDREEMLGSVSSEGQANTWPAEGPSPSLQQETLHLETVSARSLPLYIRTSLQNSQTSSKCTAEKNIKT